MLIVYLIFAEKKHYIEYYTDAKSALTPGKRDFLGNFLFDFRALRFYFKKIKTAFLVKFVAK
jgi:hypothetical protein